MSKTSKQAKWMVPIDKSNWGPGGWHDEPDMAQFVTHGYPCFMVRNPHTGTWNGYIGVHKKHPWWGEYDRLDVNVHGGITFGQQGPFYDLPDSQNFWWLGFDTAHYNDYAPGYRAMGLNMGGVYRHEQYVRNEIRSLARQAYEAEHRHAPPKEDDDD